MAWADVLALGAAWVEQAGLWGTVGALLIAAAYLTVGAMLTARAFNLMSRDSTPGYNYDGPEIVVVIVFFVLVFLLGCILWPVALAAVWFWRGCRLIARLLATCF